MKLNLCPQFARTVFYISLCVAVSGCAVSGTGDPFILAAPMDNHAVVYHYRTDGGFRGSAIQWDVLSNDAPLARIGNGGYFKEVTGPGTRVYRTKKNADAGPVWFIDGLIFNPLQKYKKAIQLQLEAGRIYFLNYKFIMGKRHPDVGIVSSELATKDIEDLLAFPAAVVVVEDK